MASASYSTSSKYTESTNIQKLMQSITINIQKIAQNVSQIENMNMQIGTVKDSETLRERLLKTENLTNQLAKDTNNELKELNDYVKRYSNDDRDLKFQKDRLTSDLLKTLNKFKEVLALATQKQRESNERTKANMSFNSNEDGFRMEPIQGSKNVSLGYGMDDFNAFDSNSNQSNQLQRHTQISMENDVNLTQLKEREAALHKLESDIVEVNMIFKDLAVIVHDQGDVIDSIESNVEATQMRVVEANSHLQSAVKNQTKARKKKFILFCILAFVVAIIVLIIILSVQPWRS